MKLDEKALEAAILAYEEPVYGSDKKHTSLIISAYLSALTPPDVAGLVERLNTKAGVIEMGERIAWGLDSSIMREAITLIQSQAASMDFQARVQVVAAEEIAGEHRVNVELTARIAELESENALLREREGWSTIETAPKDVDILVGGYLDGEWKCSVYRIRNEFWREDWDDEPTHWTYPPASPSHQEQNNG